MAMQLLKETSSFRGCPELGLRDLLAASTVRSALCAPGEEGTLFDAETIARGVGRCWTRGSPTLRLTRAATCRGSRRRRAARRLRLLSRAQIVRSCLKYSASWQKHDRQHALVENFRASNAARDTGDALGAGEWAKLPRSLGDGAFPAAVPPAGAMPGAFPLDPVQLPEASRPTRRSS